MEEFIRLCGRSVNYTTRLIPPGKKDGFYGQYLASHICTILHRSLPEKML